MNAAGTPERNRFSLRVGAASDPGVVRSRNEDSYCVILEADDVLAQPLQAVVAVADGMGGHDAGDVASSLVVGRVRTAFTTLPAGDPGALHETLGALAGRASAELYAEARDRDAVRGMGSTLTVLLLVGDRIWTAHIGDTRLYRWRDGTLMQLTEDHTWAAEQDRMGVSEEARSLGGRNLLTRCLGIDPKVTADLGDYDVQDGDRLLLCSDGLHGPVDDEAIARSLATIVDPQQAAKALVNLAIQAGAPDNVTAVVADVIPQTEQGAIEHERRTDTDSGTDTDTDSDADDQAPTWPPAPIAATNVRPPADEPDRQDDRAPIATDQQRRMREIAGEAPPARQPFPWPLLGGLVVVIVVVLLFRSGCH